ncbi:MAG: YghX family hydrolase [Rubrivivax sp.]
MSFDHRRLTAADFDPEVLVLFDQYVHGQIDRRGFLDRAAKAAAAAGTTSAALLAALSPNFAAAQQVKPDDARLKTEFLEFDAPLGHGKGRAYVVRPAQASGALPVVLVIHENRGLNPHIEDVTRRLALEGYLAVAPDALFTKGGYPGDEDKARALFGTLDLAKAREDFVAAAGWAQGLPGSNGRLGAVGFCYGGGVVNTLATRVPALRAGAPFYGPGPSLDAVDKIKAELFIVFAENDPRINEGWPAYKDTLEVVGVKFTAQVYPGTQHGFHNDTTPRYDERAAKDAWSRTLALFNRTLKG